MADEMDVVSSLVKIAKELREGADPLAAAFLIDWIAQGLQRELDLAAQRSNRHAALQLEANRSPWYGQPLCEHGCQHCDICSGEYKRSNRGYDMKQIGTGDEDRS